MPKKYIRRTGYSKKGGAGYKRKSPGLKKALRSAAKRFMARAFKRRELKNAEQKWNNQYTANGTSLAQVTVTGGGMQLSGDHVVCIQDLLLAIPEGTDVNHRIGNMIQVQGIDVHVTLGNIPTGVSPAYWSGYVSLAIINEKSPGGFAPIDYVSGVPTLKYPTTAALTLLSNPYSINPLPKAKGLYSVKFINQIIDTPNMSSVQNGFDQGNHRCVQWSKTFKFNRQFNCKGTSTDSYTGCRKFLFVAYYESPYTVASGSYASRPKAYWTTNIKFKDL